MYFKNIRRVSHNLPLLCLCLILAFLNAKSQNTYYSKSTGNLNTLSTWGLNTNGTGVAPANFTSANCTYIITNTTSATIGANWTVSGTNSRVQVGDGSTAVNFTIPTTAALTGTIDVANTASLTILNTTIPTMGNLSSGSTVEYARTTAQTVNNATYYNLILSGGGIKSLANTTNTGITNNLIINTGLSFRLHTITTLTCTISGNISGSGGIIGSTTSNLAIGGTGNLGTLTFTTTLSLYQFAVNRTSSGSLTLGSNLTVSNAFNHTNGTIDLNGRLLTLSSAITFPASLGNGMLAGSTTSSLSINGTGTITNALYMNQSSSNSRSLSALTLNRTGRTLTLGNDLIIPNTLTQTAGIIGLGTGLLTLNGAITFPTSAANGSFLGSATGSLTISGAGTITNSLFMSQTNSTTQTINSLTFNRTGIALTVGNSMISGSQFIHTNGTITIGTALLSLNGSITFPASASNGVITGSATSSLSIGGSGTITNALYMNQTSATTRNLSGFAINRTGQTLTLGNNVIVSSLLTQTAGNINLAGTLFTLNGAATFPTAYVNGYMIGSTTSSISIAGTGAFTNSLYMDQSSSNSRSIHTLTFNRTGQTLTLGNDLIIPNTLTQTAGIIGLGNGLLTLNGAINFPTSAANGSFLGSATGSLTISGAGTITNSLFMSQTNSTTQTINSLTFNRTGIALTVGNSMISGSQFIHTNGTITIGTALLSLNGSITFPASTSNGVITGSATSSLSIGGSGTITNALYMNQTSATTRNLSGFTINRTGQTVTLGNNVIVSSLLTQTAGNINLAGTLFTLNGAATFPTAYANGYMIGSTTSSISIAGTGAFTNSLYMDQSSSNSRSIHTLTFNRTGQTLTLGNDLIIPNTLTQTAGIIGLGNGLLTLNGAITFPTSAANGSFLGSATGSLTISGAGTITNSLFMSQTNSTTQTINSLTFNRTGIALTVGNSMISGSQFIHTNGTITIGTALLSLNGSITFPASTSNGVITGSATSSLSIGGSGTITNALYMNQTSAATRNLSGFAINRTGQTVTLGNNVIVSSLLTQTAGNINLAGTLFTLNGAATFPTAYANGYMIGSTTSSISIAGTGAFTNSLYMDQTNTNSRSIHTLTFNRTGQTLTLGNDLIIPNTLTQTAGIIGLGNGLLTLNGAITFPTSAANGSFLGSATGSLTISGAGTITNSLFMSQTNSTTQTIGALTLNRTGVSLRLGNNVICGSQLIHTNGTITINATVLTLNGSITFPASASNGVITGAATSSLSIGGSGTITNALYMDQTSATTRNLSGFTINRTGQTVTLGNTLIISGPLTQTAGNIDLAATLLTLNGAITFPISSVNGYLIGSATSSIAIGGSGAIANSMYMDQTSTASRSMSSILLNRTGQTLTLGNPLNLINILTPTLGTFASAGNLTLAATSASLVARIATIGGSVTGNVTSESFASAGNTGWALLGSAGITGRTFTDWNDDFIITCASCPNGSTVGGSSFTSITTYNEAVGGVYGNPARYVNINNITDAMTPGTGYWVYLGNGNTTTSDILFDVTGPVYQGNCVINLSYTNSGGGSATDWGYNLIANPYPSPISWSLLRNGNANVSDAIYVYNADLGGFASYVATVSSPAVGAGGIGNMIPAGQAFYVKANAATSLTAQETNKASSTQVLLKSTQTQNTISNPPLIRIKADGANMHNETALYFDANAHPFYETNYDAISLSPDPGILDVTSEINDTSYAINGLDALTHNMSIPIKITTGTTGTYQIYADDYQSIPSGACLMLHDNVTNTDHDLRTGNYSCTISNTETTARFLLNIFITNTITVTSNAINPSCVKLNNGSIIANAAIAGTYNYYWKDSSNQVIKTSLAKTTADTLNYLYSGNYKVDITSSGCNNGSQSFNLQVQNITNASFIPSTSSAVLINDTALVNFTNTSSNADSYQWAFGDGNQSNSINPTNSYISEGEYPVTLLAFNTACGDTAKYSTTISISAAIATGIKEEQTITTSSNHISISRDKNGYYAEFNDIEPTDALISVWNILGKKVCKDIIVNHHLTTGKVYIPLGEVTNELLIITVTSDKGERVYRKLIND